MKYLFFVSLLSLVFPLQMKAQDTVRFELLEKPGFVFEIENLSKLYIKENGVVNVILDIELIEEGFMNNSNTPMERAETLKFQVSKNDLGYQFISFVDADKLSIKERISLIGYSEPVIISIDIGNSYEVIPAAYLSTPFKY